MSGEMIPDAVETLGDRRGVLQAQYRTGQSGQPRLVQPPTAFGDLESLVVARCPRDERLVPVVERRTRLDGGAVAGPLARAQPRDALLGGHPQEHDQVELRDEDVAPAA